MSIEDSLIDEFLKNGYTIMPWRMDQVLMDRAILETKGTHQYRHTNYNLNNRIENAWMFSDAVRKIAADGRVMSFLGDFFGVEAFPFQTLNFERGSGQRLHSDFYHFSSTSYEKMAGVWVALEDVHEDAGPLRVVPGSHKLPFVFPEDIQVDIGPKDDPYEYYHLYEDYIDSLVSEMQASAKEIILGKGQVLIWHSNLIHGGGDVKALQKTRLSQVTHYFPARGAYFSPIQSRRNIFRRRYRFPYNVISGRRVIPFLSNLF